jgi:hypothetical protein
MPRATFPLRLSAEERHRYDSAARAAGMPTTTWIRRCCDLELVRDEIRREISQSAASSPATSRSAGRRAT